ncbi:MAG TPA: cyanophycin synthetase [Patescibacteria group bacterium]
MIYWLKRILYFPIASYFRFFAVIRLKLWRPKIIVVTGSNGKTTLLHLLEAQLGDKAKYSHHANSSFGIPFDILGLKRKTLLKTEWIGLFLAAPLRVFAKLPREKIYVVETDCDRPGEGKFLADLLKPEVVLWVSTSRTHSMSFDNLIARKSFKNVEEAIAYEFGYFLEYCKSLAVINGDSLLEKQQVMRTKAIVKEIIKNKVLDKYETNVNGTKFVINDKVYKFKDLLPEEIFYSIEMCKILIEYLNLPFDEKFSNFIIPPGRSSIFEGIKETTIIDSSYNANFSSMSAVLKMYREFPAKTKWAVIGDMLEQGKEEQEEHEKLAELLAKQDLARIIFLGPRVNKYTFPKLKSLISNTIPVDSFINPKEVLDFLNEHLKGEETILFKGARFMEGVIEHLLKNKSDAIKLSRREKIWEIRRSEWGL